MNSKFQAETANSKRAPDRSFDSLTGHYGQVVGIPESALDLRQVHVPVSRNAQLSVWLTHPDSQPPRAIVVFVHGFCGNKSENGLFDALAQKLAAAGAATVQYDWRGTGESTGDFIGADLKQHVQDLLELTQWLKAFTESDRRIPMVAVGFSLGATIVGSAIREDLSFERIAYLSPATRPNLSMWPRYNNGRTWSLIEQQGFVEKEPGGVKFGRPILESIRDTDLGERSFSLSVPLLVAYGNQDSRIPPEHTKHIIEASRQSGGRSLQAVAFDQATHSFKPANENWPRLAQVLSTFALGD